MPDTYFHRVHKYSPTRFWVNNPTPAEAILSIREGAINCTTNPAYSYKQFTNEDTGADVRALIKEALRETDSTEAAVDYIQQKLVRKLLDIFLPVYEKDPGRQGFVSIQGDPNRDEDANHIVNEMMVYSRLERNFIAKIPVTEAGLIAMEGCLREGFPVIATEIMGIAQTIAACDVYTRITAATGRKPAFFVTHITGIFDQHLGQWMERTGTDIPEDIMWYAGLTLCKKQYEIFRERGLPGIMLGGGARGFKHFTELVGYEMDITINWKNFADKLVEDDQPVISRYGSQTPEAIVEELLEKVPDFKRAYVEDGLSPKEFQDFGPVALFRSMFLDGWNGLKKAIDEIKQDNHR